jgi:hypothetical protein
LISDERFIAIKHTLEPSSDTFEVFGNFKKKMNWFGMYLDIWAFYCLQTDARAFYSDTFEVFGDPGIYEEELL